MRGAQSSSQKGRSSSSSSSSSLVVGVGEGVAETVDDAEVVFATAGVAPDGIAVAGMTDGAGGAAKSVPTHST